ncbi:MAG: Xylulose kinase [Candidatus Magnetoglobus multicellularis str. Araruama]|uniref:Xylulose kinase n=1 Tax=Candidatus Magnetoglobus multicellularis str. Araruama TaxID=890399 RepID=A0A1V1P9C4_9BACT|nr:MAG: Xylulose kinase [Candidatus Magnetoglobus multicellularis str. Araruama]
MNPLHNEYILAIDHGTSGLKVALVNTYGKIIDFEYSPTPTHYFPDGGAEQDPEDWWQAFLRATKRLLAKDSVVRKDIIAISVSSTFSSTVAVDRSGTPLMNCLTWMDSRGAPYVKSLIGKFPRIAGYNLFKVMKWIYYTGGGPQLSGKDDIAHVIYIQNKHPDIYEKTYKFLSSKDFLNLRLTGKFAASYDSIMLFWVTNTRDINKIHYSDSLIASLGIDREKLPDLMHSVDILGTLKPELANELGIGKDIKVVLGSPDHQAALLGSGAVKDFEGHVYIGTSSWIECIVPFKKTDMFHSIASLPSAIPGKYQCINEQDIAGGCLSFLLNNIILHDNEFYIGKQPADPYDKLNKMAGRVSPGSDKLIFTPWLNGERTPVDSTTLRGGFHNISLRTTADHIARAVLEGVAYNTRWSLHYVEKFIEQRMDPLNFIGGGARSDLWCQIFSNVMNRQIRRVKDPIEANCRGAALIASVGLGRIVFSDITMLIEYDKVFEPEVDIQKIYDDLYQAFREIYRKNKTIYYQLNRR